MISLLLGFALACFADDVKAKVGPVTLVYEIEKPSQPAEQKVDLKRLSHEVKNRLDAAGISRPVVKATNDSQLTVTLSDGQSDVVDRAKWAIGRSRDVEFRIVADQRIVAHSALIDLAKGQLKGNVGNDVRDADKKLVGKWVKLKRGAKLPDSIPQRKVKGGGNEFLVVIDPFDVTGEYITKADLAIGDRGPEVQFELNEKGAKRFGDLTGSNLPDPGTGIARLLATIVDDEVQSTANIESRITDHGRITGHFTESEALNLANSLKSDPLFAKLKLISESK